MRKLNDEEIRHSLQSRPKIKTMDDLVKNFHLLAKAQFNQDIKDFMEWGEEICVEHPHSYNEWHRFSETGSVDIPRRSCPECWQSLKQLVEE